MGRKTKVPYEQKIEAVEDYLSGKKSVAQICFEMDVVKKSFDQWIRKYKLHGTEGLKPIPKNAFYSPELKYQAVTDYLAGVGSLFDICNKYDISSHSILQRWIIKYNGHETFKSHNGKGDKLMTKGRKTTYRERIDIVAFCISNNYNYQMTSDKFQVSYSQVYTWVKKYKIHGYEALSDNRGKRKIPHQMSDIEKLTANLKLIEAQNKRLQMENDFLKKLREVERRG